MRAIALLLTLAAATAPAQADDPVEALAALRGEWLARVKVLRPKVAAAASLDDRVALLRDGDPRADLLPRFAALARKAPSCDTLDWVLIVGTTTLGIAAPPDDVVRRVRAVVDDVLPGRLGDADVESIVDKLASTAWVLGEAFVARWLERIERDSPHRAVRAGALYGRIRLVFAPVELEPARRTRAAALLERLGTDYRGTFYDEQARGWRLDLATLQPGMPAPDFALPDTEGRTLRLSDYRGKVVALLFWGFW